MVEAVKCIVNLILRDFQYVSRFGEEWTQQTIVMLIEPMPTKVRYRGLKKNTA